MKMELTLPSVKWNPADVAARCNCCLFPVTLIKLHCPRSKVEESAASHRGTAWDNWLRQGNDSAHLPLAPQTQNIHGPLPKSVGRFGIWELSPPRMWDGAKRRGGMRWIPSNILENPIWAR